MNNLSIRGEMLKASVKLWEIAEAMGIADYSLSKKLRHELPVEEQARIVEIIHRIEEAKKHGSAPSS